MRWRSSATSSQSTTSSREVTGLRSRVERARSLSTDGEPRARSKATIDGTVRAFGVDRARYAPSAQAESAIERLLVAAKELRPSLIKIYIDEAAPGATDLSAHFSAVPGAKIVRLQ